MYTVSERGDDVARVCVGYQARCAAKMEDGSMDKLYIVVRDSELRWTGTVEPTLRATGYRAADPNQILEMIETIKFVTI